MTGADLLTFTVVTALLVMTPGPNGVLIARTVPTSGRAAGLANIAGFVTGFFGHGTLSILGISVLLVQSELAFSIVKYLGAAYLGWIGVKALVSARRDAPNPLRVAPARRTRTLARAYVEGLLTNALNPKVSMFYLAAFPQFLGGGAVSPAAGYLLVALHAALNVLWFVPIVLLFHRVSRVAGGRRFQRLVKTVTGVVFIGFAVQMAVYRPG